MSITINLYPEMNKQIADLLLDCEDNGMMLYAGTYIKELERQIEEYRGNERYDQGGEKVRERRRR